MKQSNSTYAQKLLKNLKLLNYCRNSYYLSSFRIFYLTDFNILNNKAKLYRYNYYANRRTFY